MEYDRKLYLEKLIARKGNGLIKIITGARRAGKSYLMNELFYKYLLKSGVKSKDIIRTFLSVFPVSQDKTILLNICGCVNDQQIVKPRRQERKLNYLAGPRLTSPRCHSRRQKSASYGKACPTPRIRGVCLLTSRVPQWCRLRQRGNSAH